MRELCVVCSTYVCSVCMYVCMYGYGNTEEGMQGAAGRLHQHVGSRPIRG